MTSRRGAGEGSIYQRKDGRWVAELVLDTGRRRFLYGRTRQEAATKLKEAIRTIDSGLPLPQGQERLRDYLPRWLETQRHRLRPRVWMRYEQIVRLNLTPGIGNVQLARLTPMQVQRFYADVVASGRSTSTAHHVHAVLHRALEQAVRWGLVARNVADLVDAPRLAETEMQVLDREQVQALLATAEGTELGPLLTLAVTTGMRQGELLALRWRDVDLDRQVVSVRGSLTNVNGQFQINEPKTSRSRRQVELGALALEALRAHRVSQAELRLAMPADWNPWDLVFIRADGKPYTNRALLDRFAAVLRDARLPRVRFHDLRHTAATLMLSRGVHPKIVSEMLGHATIGITLDLYSHVTPTMQREAAATMDALLR